MHPLQTTAAATIVPRQSVRVIPSELQSDRPRGALTMPQKHIAAIALEKAYRKGEHQVPVLRGVDIEIARGEFVSIVGQSGSGKSTLLHLLGLLDGPDVGEIFLEAERIDDLPRKSRFVRLPEK